MKKNWNKDQWYDLLIMIFRFYLCIYMIDYGVAKIIGEQFSDIKPEILNMQLKDVDDFYLAWYLFGKNSFFNWFIGLAQILTGVLLLSRKTYLWASFALLPILITIFLIDASFTTTIFKSNLTIRILGMIVVDLFILYHQKNAINLGFRTIVRNLRLRFDYSWWIYPMLLVAGFSLDFLIAALTIPVKLLINKLFFR